MREEVIQGDCLEVMKGMAENSIDLTVTSPPYDNLRDYKGYTFDFEGIAKELYRVTRQGGVVVWIVGDATIQGSETGTSFKQALYFKEIGFNLHDTMIYQKQKIVPSDPRNRRYYPEHEYMFVFSKGFIAKCNYIKIACKHAGKHAVASQTKKNGLPRMDRKLKNKNHVVKETKIKGNIWCYSNISVKGHPAPFPEKLAEDHILSWSNEGDTVLDPMAGSGTTLKMAKKHNRNYIGIEISKEYVDIITKRIK